MKVYYDGYHFSAVSPDIYNPYSILNAMQKKRINSFWFESGTPTFLIEKLNEFNVLPSEIGGQWVAEDQFDAPTDNMVSALPLLYQSGYVTIKKYNDELNCYFLDVPNKEVREGLMKTLLPHNVLDNNVARKMIVDATFAFHRDDIDSALNYMKNYFLKVPYANNTKSEEHYQQMLYVMFDLMGGHPTLEQHTSGGRIDLALRSKTTIYVIELKTNDTAKSALDQINNKNYAAFYASDGLAIVKIGISFDTSKGTIEDWEVER